MNEVKNEQWLAEYNGFLKGERPVPEDITVHVIGKIEKLLNPNASSIFAKILGIHFAVGTLSLAICHQFGLNPFGTERSLADWFMQIGGHSFCMISCGVLFTALSIVAAGYFLTVEEVRVLRRTEVLQALCLAVISLGAFAFFGAHLSLTFVALWFLGALLGGFAATELVWKFRVGGTTRQLILE